MSIIQLATLHVQSGIKSSACVSDPNLKLARLDTTLVSTTYISVHIPVNIVPLPTFNKCPNHSPSCEGCE